MSVSAKRPQFGTDRARVADVQEWIDAQVAPLESEDCLVSEAGGRVLAEDLAASVDVPPFDRAAVDGIALRSEETIGASTYNPLVFRLVPGADELPPGSAVYVESGDRLPSGADAVVAIDQVVDNGDGSCTVTDAVAVSVAVEPRGRQVACGSTLLIAGRRLRAVDVGLLAAAGIARLPVVRRPRVRCIITGRNLTEADRPLPAGAVHDANGPLLQALIARDGGVLVDQRRIGRDVEAIRDALSAPGADIIVVAGSTGLGRGDHAAAALAGAGKLIVHGVALRPGDSAGIGLRSDGVPVFLLPGAPAACVCSYELLAGRAIRRLGGRNPALPFASRMMTAERKIVSQIGTLEVCAVRRVDDDRVVPLASFEEAGLAAAMRADGFVLLPEGSEGYPPGAAVTVHLYDYDECEEGLPARGDSGGLR